MEAQRTPRDRNHEADDLSNFRTGGFDPENEVKVDLGGSELAGADPAAG